jgi:hypothetical protein
LNFVYAGSTLDCQFDPAPAPFTPPRSRAFARALARFERFGGFAANGEPLQEFAAASKSGTARENGTFGDSDAAVSGGLTRGWLFRPHNIEHFRQQLDFREKFVEGYDFHVLLGGPKQLE